MGLDPRCRVILWGVKKETLLPIKMRNTTNYKMWKKNARSNQVCRVTPANICRASIFKCLCTVIHLILAAPSEEMDQPEEARFFYSDKHHPNLHGLTQQMFISCACEVICGSGQ